MAAVAIRFPMEPALTSESFVHQHHQPTFTSAVDTTETFATPRPTSAESSKSETPAHRLDHEIISPHTSVEEESQDVKSGASSPSTPGIHVSMADDNVEVKDEAIAEDKTTPTKEAEVATETEKSPILEKSTEAPEATETASEAKIEALLDDKPVAEPATESIVETAAEEKKESETNGTSVTEVAPVPIESKDDEPVKSSEITAPPTLETGSKIISQSRPLSQRFMSPPTHTRQRSASPGRFPVKVDDASATSRTASPARSTHREHSPMRGLSGDLPAVSFPPPPPRTDTTRSASPSIEPSSPPPPGMFRKASSGFGGLLGRMGTIRKTALSPPARRNSATSSNDHPAASLKSIADLPEGEMKASLRDRFKSLREAEEHPETELFDADTHKAPTDDGKVIEEESANGSVSGEITTRTKRASSSNSLLKNAQTNPNLPPGTASGMSAGPAREPKPVDWDLWQAVVEEGPAAVSRTSGEGLSRAIASGIPAAIRGVVWQVLAESKSDDLEGLYRTLKTRGAEGTDKALPEKPLPLPRTDSEISHTEKESTTSSRSSIHSASSSNPAASSVTTPPASIEGNTAELQHKLLAEKQKRESAALQKLEKAIRRDLGSRTSYSKYTQSAGLQDGLFGVCKAYALFDTPIGYAQGINFIAMPLLFNMPEEEAFTLLVRMMHHYQLRTLFEPEMPGLHLRLYQFERLLEEHEPALYCHLKRRHVAPQLYATQWFLTLFAYRFPLQLVLRVYDLLFSEGLTAILKFGIVLMQKNKEALLQMKDMSHLTTFLKEKLFDAYIDKSPSASSLLDSGFFGSVTGGADKELYRADELVQDATQIKISPETLAAYEAEWDELRRAEKEKEAELENLRTTNSALSVKVKTLEERVQQHDTEHVNIASDLVKYKVENDSLHDTKEALEMQVQHLQKMLESQPAEVEAKLKEEMDRIMQRNLEVQNENRHLQDELENTEQQLVKISMTHAETQADYDTLKQKWNGLQAMMNGK